MGRGGEAGTGKGRAFALSFSLSPHSHPRPASALALSSPSNQHQQETQRLLTEPGKLARAMSVAWWDWRARAKRKKEELGAHPPPPSQTTTLTTNPPQTAPGISASPSEENLRYFNVMILGPTSSPYEGERERGEEGRRVGGASSARRRRCWRESGSLDVRLARAPFRPRQHSAAS